MKIGLVCPYDILRGGGVQECVTALQEELSRRGHKVKIITPTPPSGRPSVNKDHIYFGAAAKVRSPFSTSAEVSASINVDEITRVLDQEAFDILHFHEPWVPVLSRQLLVRSSSVNIATFHAKLPETVMSKTIERAITPYTRSALKYLDYLTAVSDSAAEYVRSLTGENVTIIPNGIDLKKYRAPAGAKNPSKQKTIVYIGRLEKRKGVKYLLRACAVLKNKLPDVQLLIGGDGPERDKLEELAKNLKLDNIKFLGYVNENQKIKLLNKADVFVSPALFGESFGIVLLEAMAAGAVTVAGNNSGYAGVLKGRGALSLINPKDTTEFARKLEIMLTDEEIRKLWLDWAKTYVKQFDYRQIVGQYERLYKTAYKSGPGKAKIK